MALPFFEPEETVGQQWHRLVGGATSWPRHPEAAVRLEEVRGRLGVMFRALGGAGGVRLMAAGHTVSRHRLSVPFGFGAFRRREACLIPSRQGHRAPGRTAVWR